MAHDQGAQRLTGVGAGAVVLGDQVVGLTPTELPGEFTPESANLGAVVLDDRRAGLQVGADECGPSDIERAEVGVAVRGDEFLKLLREVLDRSAAEQVVQRQHRVGLAATEVGLKVHHRARAGFPVQASQRPRQQVAQALGEVGASEELDRIAVLGARRLTRVDKVKVGRELRGGERAARHVIVGPDHLTPGTQPGARFE